MKLSLMHEEQNKTVVDEFHWKVLLDRNSLAATGEIPVGGFRGLRRPEIETILHSYCQVLNSFDRKLLRV